ncbi:hypothetical protein ACIRL0_28315 [Streptomyces sp. NPDC102365]|uniref:hypothetical protein n=1 Tax=Streptomyces sp. NPDC102365 TaxID=3366162 RepID=UPI00381AE4B6
MALVPSPPDEGGLVRPLSCAAAPDEPDADGPSAGEPTADEPDAEEPAPRSPGPVPPGAEAAEPDSPAEPGCPALPLPADAPSSGTNSTRPVGATALADDEGR